MQRLDDISEESVSMGPAALMSGNESSSQIETTDAAAFTYLSPRKDNHVHCVMGNLSVSSITAFDSSQQMHMSLSPPSGTLKPDILASTFCTKPSDSIEDLSISIGPLSALSSLGTRDTFPRPSQIKADKNSQLDNSIACKIKQLELKKNFAVNPETAGCKAFSSCFTQTEPVQCGKCVEMLQCFDGKLLEIANEFQQQYNSQLQVIEDQHAAAEESHKQIKDLMDQLDVADKQLKVSWTTCVARFGKKNCRYLQ